MHLKFAPVDEKFIKEKIDSGFYSSETELVKDAVRHMREEEEKFNRFEAAVRVGDEQITNGQTVPYSSELMKKIRHRAIKKALKAKKVINSDATRGNYKVRLSVQATTDIEDILHYTYQQYGQKQEEKYYKIICDALDLIESTPLVGHKRTDLSTQHRSLNAGEHVIVYQVIEKEVFISRILHGRMDFDQHLP